jgi:hypothetical protein
MRYLAMFLYCFDASRFGSHEEYWVPPKGLGTSLHDAFTAPQVPKLFVISND